MENNKNLDEVKKGDFSIADIETIRLTSKSYIVKSQIKPKFWSKSLITTIILILIFYINVIFHDFYLRHRFFLVLNYLGYYLLKFDI